MMRAILRGTVQVTALLLLSAATATAGTVADAKTQPIGTEVTIENLVITSTTDLISSTSSKNFHAQDATGGITIYGSNAAIDALLAVAGEGDEVTLTGKVDIFNGLFEIDLYDGPATIIKTGSPGIPAPTAVTVADFQEGSATAEGFESMLVKLNNVVFLASGTFGVGNYNVAAFGTTTPVAVVRVSTSALNLVGQPIPGGACNLTGIFSQYDTTDPRNGGYQLLLRSTADIEQLTPSASSGTSITMKDAPQYTITLEGTPIGSGSLVYRIKQTADKMFPNYDSTVQGGTLYLPDGVTPVTLNADLPGNQVKFTPAPGVSGWFQFKFAVFQSGYAESSPAPVNIFIQDGSVIMTEIMYDPGGFEYDWEYVELLNLTGSPIALDTLYNGLFDSATGTKNNLANASSDGGTVPTPNVIPAGGVRVVCEQTAYRTTPQFLNEWNPGAGDVTYPTEGGDLSKVQRKHLVVLDYAGTSGAVAAPALRNSGDLLALFATDGRCLDVVKYENGTNGWPAANGWASIFLEADKLTASDNDVGANWRVSATGVTGGIAYQGQETAGPPRDSDVGSPALIPTQTTAPVSPPIAQGGTAGIFNQNQVTFSSIQLVGTDPPNDPPVLTFKLVSGCEGFSPTSGSAGTLLDGGTLAPVGPGSTLSGDTLLFKPTAGMTGRYAIAFKVNDGTADSQLAYMTLFVQDQNTVVITEVMYNPWNQLSSEWEWIEVRNLSNADVPLHSLLDEVARDYVYTGPSEPVGNLVGITIPANSTRVIAKDVVDPFASWLTEWQIANPSLIHFVPQAQWPALNNNTGTGVDFCDRIYLYAADGRLLDVVAYDDSAPWPVDNGNSSIYLAADKRDTFLNDNGLNWSLSTIGVANAYATLTTHDDGGVPVPNDIGSPALLPDDLRQIYDFDRNGRVNDVDLTAFELCGSGPGVAHSGTSVCQICDADDDNDVDVKDFAAFQRCYNPDGATPPAECLQ